MLIGLEVREKGIVPAAHTHYMENIIDWQEIVAAKEHEHVLSSITDWEQISGTALVELINAFYTHRANSSIHGGNR